MRYKAANEVSRQALIQAGLTTHQAAIYEALIQHGPLKATKLAFLAGVPRTLSYKVLEELEVMSLIGKKDVPGKVSLFTPAHPLKLKELADKRLNDAKDAKLALDSTLATLISDFNTVTGAPGVRILEGAAGFAELFEDQLNERQPISIIRSPNYTQFPELADIVLKHLNQRDKLRIPVRSLEAFSERSGERRALDAEHGVERRYVAPELLAIPADVVIYANKVALNAYEQPLMTTIIENMAINKTFRILFEYMWATAGK